MDHKYTGFYLGIVVQNNDPDKRGRCKIFIPHVNSYAVDDWLPESKDRQFAFVDKTENVDLELILPKIKDTLPWAEFAGQVFGGNATGRYNATTKKGYVHNHNQWNEEGEPAFINRPASQYNNSSPPKDAFTDPNDVNIVNPHSYAYTPSDYSTLATGMFSIPNVGAHVWCFFEAGDVNCPVYFASSYSTEDIKRIYTTNKHSSEMVTAASSNEKARAADGSPDYPGTYENIDALKLAGDAQVFRSKHVINSNKHAIEMIDTDSREILKFTHYSGSFKEFNNFANIEFAPNNDQKLVIGNQFNTIRSNTNLYVGLDSNSYINGDVYETIGKHDLEAVARIRKILGDIHQYIQLFDVRRVGQFPAGAEIPNPNPEFVDTPDGASAGSIFAANLPNMISPLQRRQKSRDPILPVSNAGFAICPVCNNVAYEFDEAAYLASLQPRIYITSAPKIAGPLLICSLPQPVQSVFVNQPTYRIPLLTPSAIDLQIAEQLRSLNQIGFYRGAKCDVCNSDLLLAPTKEPGYSPSSANGEFEPEKAKAPGGELDQIIEATAPALIEAQRLLSGGDKIVTVSKNKIETIGLIMNDLPSIRVDPVGKLRAENVYVSPEAVYQSYRPAAHVEPVEPLSMPGGDYILTATNKYKLLVGAKGINIKTFGPIDMYGTIVNMTGQQLNINSQYEINLDGGERLSIRARKIAFSPREHSPVLVDGALHVARNAIVQGGMYVDGQFGTPAIASLREYGETSDGIWAPPSFAVVGASTGGEEFTDSLALSGGDVTTGEDTAAALEDIEADADPDLSGLAGGWAYVACGMTAPIPVGGAPTGVPVTVLIPPHTHLYERPPSQLFNSLQALRMFFADPKGRPTSAGGQGASINDVKRVSAATPVNDLATGEPKASSSDYRDSIRETIFNHIQSSSEWSEYDPDSLTVNVIIIEPTKFTDNNTRVSGYLSVTISRQANSLGAATGSALATYVIKFDIIIDPTTKEFISEGTAPVATRTSGADRGIGI